MNRWINHSHKTEWDCGSEKQLNVLNLVLNQQPPLLNVQLSTTATYLQRPLSSLPKVAAVEFNCSWNYYIFGNSKDSFFKVMPFCTVDLSFRWSLASFGWWIVVLVGKFEVSTYELCINTKKRWQGWVVQFNKREKKYLSWKN